jgi:hypothetical protein
MSSYQLQPIIWATTRDGVAKYTDSTPVVCGDQTEGKGIPLEDITLFA